MTKKVKRKMRGRKKYWRRTEEKGKRNREGKNGKR